MQGHEIKLAKSQHDTRKWRENVENFIQSERFDRLESEHKAAMVAQLEALEALDDALTLRMQLLGLPV